MKFMDEYRDPALARKLASAIAAIATHPWTLMEICGGQTHAIVKFGLDELLPPTVSLVHGPGCPVCVTSPALIDAAIELARRPGVTLCTFGDMLRVPGSTMDLLLARAAGADVRITYSPLDAVAFARTHPEREVVFFAVGFETTAPATAVAVLQAAAERRSNFSVLSAHVLVPPAMRALLGAPDNRVQGFLAAGHVCTVSGLAPYPPLAATFGVPIVVTGFEPVDILDGVLRCVRQLERGDCQVENAYARVVRPRGNPAAQAAIAQVFDVCDRDWRGLGVIPASGLAVRPELRRFDAVARHAPRLDATTAVTECRSGDVLRGVLKPIGCPAFGTRCTPEHPLGAPMVSSEGACAAYYRFRRQPAQAATFECGPGAVAAVRNALSTSAPRTEGTLP